MTALRNNRRRGPSGSRQRAVRVFPLRLLVILPKSQ